MQLKENSLYIANHTPPLHTKLAAEGRILKDRDWEYYNGYNVAYRPHNMTADDLLRSHRELWGRAFHWRSVLRRLKNLPKLHPGARWLSLFMNGFYGLKRLRDNFPMDAALLPSLNPSKSECEGELLTPVY